MARPKPLFVIGSKRSGSTLMANLLNAHPRVFMPIEKTGESLCPYCGTKYTLKGGATARGH